MASCVMAIWRSWADGCRGGAGGAGEVEVLFRPERAAIVAPGAGHVKGRVSSSFFLGDRTRLLVEGVSAGTLIVETTDRRDWEPGQDVYLAIDPDALLTLDR